MRIKNITVFPQDGIDENRNKVPQSNDVIILRNLEEGDSNSSEEDQENVKEFCQDINKFQGYLAINENFETAYIPPYDDISSVIRHKLNGNEFVIVDLSKVDKKSFIQALRVN